MNQPTPRIVAHRGASHEAPENTLAAFRLAWQQHADAIEGDFYLTADRQIICIHDHETTRLAGRSLLVEKSTLEELRALDVGSWKGASYKDERPPTLPEVLHTVPRGKGMVIELKSKTQIVPVLMQELSRFDDPQLDLLMITFDEATAARCKELMPQHPVHWLTEVDQTTTPREIATTVRRAKVDGVGMQATMEVIDADFIRDLKRHGCPEFHVWTVDDVAQAKHFRDLGAVAITTNVPSVIGAALR
jgi:glycerophosphoryl diester phosphodiesterase